MSELLKLKKNYAILQKKYKLPSFSELNEDFEIEKLQDRETDYLLKGVRRAMIEKIANVVRFLELLLNPSETPTPMFILAMLKNINTETRKNVEVLYKELSSVELSSLALDVSYDENVEAEFVRNINTAWKKQKLVIKEVTKRLSMSWKKENLSDRGYLG
ncbi:hypothetical protein ACFLZZ_04395 [Nanoarchaeota archaeon]